MQTLSSKPKFWEWVRLVNGDEYFCGCCLVKSWFCDPMSLQKVPCVLPCSLCKLMIHISGLLVLGNNKIKTNHAWITFIFNCVIHTWASPPYSNTWVSNKDNINVYIKIKRVCFYSCVLSGVGFSREGHVKGHFTITQMFQKVHMFMILSSYT